MSESAVEKIGKRLTAYMEKHNVKATELAKECEVSDGTISGLRNGTYKTNFENVVKAVRRTIPDEESDLIRPYCLEVTSPKNLRFAMEYCEFHKHYDLLEEIIKKQEQDRNLNGTNKEWVKMYKLIFSLKDNPELLYNEVKLENFTTYEMRVLKEIFMLRSQYFIKNFRYFSSSMFKEIQEKIDGISNYSLKQYFKVRFDEFYSWIQMHLNNLDSARSGFRYIISLNADSQRTAHALHGLGLSYLFEDFSESLNILKKSRDIFCELSNKPQMDNVARSINFVCCYEGNLKPYIILDSLVREDYHEVAMIEYIKGNIEEANDVLNKIDIENAKDYRKAFHYFYKGMINKNKNDLYWSVMYFKKVNDKFYGKLPCLELMKLGEDNEAFLNALYGDYFKEVI